MSKLRKISSAIISLFYLAGIVEIIYSLTTYGLARNFASLFLIPFILCTIFYILIFFYRTPPRLLLWGALISTLISYLFPVMILGLWETALWLIPLLIPAVFPLIMIKNYSKNKE